MDSADYNPYWLLYLGAIVRLALVFDLITPISALKRKSLFEAPNSAPSCRASE